MSVGMFFLTAWLWRVVPAIMSVTCCPCQRVRWHIFPDNMAVGMSSLPICPSACFPWQHGCRHVIPVNMLSPCQHVCQHVDPASCLSAVLLSFISLGGGGAPSWSCCCPGYISLSLCGGDCQRYVVSRPSLPVNVSDSLNEACFQQLEDLLIRDISGRNLIV